MTQAITRLTATRRTTAPSLGQWRSAATGTPLSSTGAGASTGDRVMVRATVRVESVNAMSVTFLEATARAVIGV